MELKDFAASPPYGKWYTDARGLESLTEKQKLGVMKTLIQPDMLKFFSCLCDDVSRLGIYLDTEQQLAAKGANSIIDEMIQTARLVVERDDKDTRRAVANSKL